MIFVEPAFSATNTQISTCKEPVTIQAPCMQEFLLTMWQSPTMQANFRSATIKSTCKEVTNYMNENKDAIAIVSSKVEKQFNPVKEFRNLFLKTIRTELPLLRVANQHIDPKPESEWLSA